MRIDSDGTVTGVGQYFKCKNPNVKCDGGHIACSYCFITHEKTCVKCSLPLNRSRALEKILHSIKVQCSNSKYGCNDTLNFNEKNNHELNCIYLQCSCPHSNCDFIASSKELSLHFSDKHGNSAVKFSYDKSVLVTLKPNDGTVILQEKNDGTLFIVNNNVVSVGSAVSISCIGPNNSMTRFEYAISAVFGGCVMKFMYFTKAIQCSASANFSTLSFLVPSHFFGNGYLKLQIEIKGKS